MGTPCSVNISNVLQIWGKVGEEKLKMVGSKITIPA